MSVSEGKQFADIQSAVFGELKKKWGWLLMLGILLIILGTLGLWMSFAMTLATVMIFSALLVVGGVFQFFNAFQFKGWKSKLWHAVIALLYLVAGLVIFVDPILASISLTMVLAGILIAVGLFRIIMAFELRATQGWFWPLVSGLITILLGGMILAQWPASGFWVIGLFVSIEMILNGWSSVFVALAARRAGKTEMV
jgi:uncharacterized membrane protein HdeD (DUF308 family)